nr:MAG TPA: hypothetical protein [Caudoviricetes sp.]
MRFATLHHLLDISITHANTKGKIKIYAELKFFY